MKAYSKILPDILIYTSLSGPTQPTRVLMSSNLLPMESIQKSQGPIHQRASCGAGQFDGWLAAAGGPGGQAAHYRLPLCLPRSNVAPESLE